MASFEEALVDFLSEDVDLYGVALPEDVALPAVTYTIVSNDHIRALSGPVGSAKIRISFECYGTTSKDASNTAETIRQAIHGYRGALDDNYRVTSSVLEDEETVAFKTTDNQWLYRKTVDYLFRYAYTV